VVLANLVFCVGVAMQSGAKGIPLFVSWQSSGSHIDWSLELLYRLLAVSSPVSELVLSLVWSHCTSQNGERNLLLLCSVLIVLIVSLLSVHPSGSVVLSYRSTNGLLLLACFLHLSSTMAPGIELEIPRGRFPLLSSLSGHLSLPAEWFYFLRSEISYPCLLHLNYLLG